MSNAAKVRARIADAKVNNEDRTTVVQWAVQTLGMSKQTASQYVSNYWNAFTKEPSTAELVREMVRQAILTGNEPSIAEVSAWAISQLDLAPQVAKQYARTAIAKVYSDIEAEEAKKKDQERREQKNANTTFVNDRPLNFDEDFGREYDIESFAHCDPEFTSFKMG